MRWSLRLPHSLDGARELSAQISHRVAHLEEHHRRLRRCSSSQGRRAAVPLVVIGSANFKVSAPLSVAVSSVGTIGALGSSRKRENGGGMGNLDEKYTHSYKMDKGAKRSFSGSRPQPGDLIKFHRQFYSHYAIYLGVNEEGHEVVGHIWDDQTAPDRADTSIDARVIITPLQKVPGTYEVGNSDYDSRLVPLDSRKIVERVQQRVGERGYNLVLNNCEHFATWARYGERCSAQVDRWTVPLSLMIGLKIGLEVGSSCILGVGAAKSGLLGLVSLGLATTAVHTVWWPYREYRPLSGRNSDNEEPDIPLRF